MIFKINNYLDKMRNIYYFSSVDWNQLEQQIFISRVDEVFFFDHACKISRVGAVEGK